MVSSISAHLGHDGEDPRFGSVENVYVRNNSTVYLEFIPMVTEQFHDHYYCYSLSMPFPILIEANSLLDFHAYGLYRSRDVDSTNVSLYYVVVQSYVFK